MDGDDEQPQHCSLAQEKKKKETVKKLEHVKESVLKRHFSSFFRSIKQIPPKLLALFASLPFKMKTSAMGPPAEQPLAGPVSERRPP